MLLVVRRLAVVVGGLGSVFEQVVAQQLDAAGQVAAFAVEQVDGLGSALPATLNGDNPSALSVLGQQGEGQQADAEPAGNGVAGTGQIIDQQSGLGRGQQIVVLVAALLRQPPYGGGLGHYCGQV